MNLAFASLAVLLGLAALAAAVRCFVRGRRLLSVPLMYLALIAFTWAVMAFGTGGYRPGTPVDLMAETRPATGPISNYVTSDTCRSCHPNQYHSWHGSYHRTMTQVATENAVKGDFENIRLSGDFPGLEVEFSRDDEGHWATYTFLRPDGKSARQKTRRRIVMTTGSHHYQVYWTDQSAERTETGSDRAVWLVPYVYLFDEGSWVPRHASFLNPPEDIPEFLNWNATCIKCHSTHGITNPSPDQITLNTRAVELGISCEACHGPGKTHVEANRDPFRRYRLHRENEGDPTIINPARLDHERSSETCGQCHAVVLPIDEAAYNRWKTEGKDYRPGDDLDESALVLHRGRGDTKTHEALIPNFFERRFWSDGMVRVAGREYHGLLNTPCFDRGEMSCLSCHGMHQSSHDPRSIPEWADDQLGAGMRGNAACIQCHESFSEAETLTDHTHHAPGSSGSSCYNCHMPHTTYGLLKSIRSHQIDSPSVKATVETRRPNACNLCHLDKTLAWTAENLNTWYGQPIPDLDTDQSEIAASLLWLLKGDAGQRALIASGFGWEEAREVSGTDWMPLFLAQLNLDPYHAVRIIANRSLRGIEGYEKISRYPETKAAHADAIRIWKERTANQPTNSELLFDENGEIRQTEIERILKMRDDTPVYLNE